MRKYAAAPSASPHNEHPFYKEWLAKNGLARHKPDEPCVKIAEAIAHPIEQQTAEQHLPVGRGNAAL